MDNQQLTLQKRLAAEPRKSRIFIDLGDKSPQEQMKIVMLWKSYLRKFKPAA